MEHDKDIRFVARHFRKGLFDADTAWRRMGLMPGGGFWRLYRVAAAVAGALFLTATAAVLYHEYRPVESPSGIVAPSAKAPEGVRLVDFENAPLPVVIQRIREVYGVEVGNIPPEADKYVLSLRYEGTASDLVETINDILGTRMIVEE